MSKPGPEHRLRGMFRVLDDVRNRTLGLIAESDPELTDLARFDTAVLNRGINLLEASRLLLAVGHWEAASAMARQMFELLVNMEHIGRQSDREAACLKYQRYGLLQFAERARREVEYDRSTGRSGDERRAELAAQILASPDFDQFKDRKGKWKRNWSGHDARGLASMSPNPMREKQWEQLFVTWSEETHATPVAMLASMRGWHGRAWVDEKVDEDDREVGQMILMLVSFFIELCNVLPNVSTPDPQAQYEWTSALMDEVRASGREPDTPHSDA